MVSQEQAHHTLALWISSLRSTFTLMFMSYLDKFGMFATPLTAAAANWGTSVGNAVTNGGLTQRFRVNTLLYDGPDALIANKLVGDGYFYQPRKC